MEKHNEIKNDDEQPKVKIGLLKEETLNYYRRVSESLDSGFDNDEDKCLFVNNVVTQLSEEAISVSQNQTASRIVEVLVNFCNKDQALTLFSAFGKDWYTACTDRFASHVCQKLMIKASVYSSQSGPITPKDKSKSREVTPEENKDTDDTMSLEDLFLGLCDFIESNLDELLCHTYGSHIIRVLLEVLGGVSVEEKLVRSKLSREQTRGQSAIFKACSVLKSFHSRLLSLSEKIMNTGNIEDYLVETLPTTVIQTVLLVLKQKDDDLCQKYCEKIIQVSGLLSPPEGDSEEKSLPAMVKSTSGSYLVEQLLALSSGDVHQEIVTKVFLGRCIQFAVENQANFVLQRLLTTLTDTDQLKPVFKELRKNFEDILAIQHVGVLSKLAATCQRLNSLQDKFTKALHKAFHCYKPPERRKAIVPLLTSLSTYEVLYPTTTENSDENDTESEKSQVSEKKFPFSNVNLHGSLIIQHMLKFDPPTAAVDSVINLTSGELVELTSNPSGSHIVDAFFKSSTVHQNSKQHMIHKLKGSYMELACNKNGSRALQTIWDCSSLKQKIIIAEELSKQESKLQSDKFGHFAHRNFALHHFVHRRNDWKELQGVKAKKRKMFEDIFQDSVSNSKRKGQEAGDKFDKSLLRNEEDHGLDIGEMFKKKDYLTRGRGRGRGAGRGRGGNTGRVRRGGGKGAHGKQGFIRGRGRGRGKS